MIEDIKNKTPEKEAFCTGNSSLTYRELFLLVKEKQKKWKTAAKKELYFIQKEQALDQLTEFLTCQGTVSYTHLDVYKRQHRIVLKCRQKLL